mmetsp:Transcript_3110/g.4205  ORF Transcript_3110/g.4205 Transcript_3110/m.4205 type:complete len:165 (+) Transcript_3110:126-620(+)|eukprot:CAMPEP_0198137316 /NCGR_PEP_ID=MMETSP1443-20131203/841_1 /TAXON_ID=186043 /ORGANISM="Entomoneis sp., Strain CCMP2396" /LENGTH=164 /DNA_ID=CAMNT_0043798713 /DNA_START=79 /DNA_END=573 /DNA_ORIENTATION=-
MTSLFSRFFGTPVPKRPPVPDGKTRIGVSGFGISHNTGHAQKLAAEIAKTHPDKFETWFYFSTFQFKDFLKNILQEIPEDQKSKLSTLDTNPRTMENHKSSPFVWLDKEQASMQALGGRDKFCEWAKVEFPDDKAIQALTGLESPPLSDLFFDSTTPGGTYTKE